jgi:DNA-binding CsgD family transcriptional regulator
VRVICEARTTDAFCMKQSSLVTRNKIERPDGSARQPEQEYMEVAAAFARTTYSSVYIIDYAKMSFEYVSENPLFLAGYSAAEVLAMGYDFYFRCVPGNEIRLLEQLNEAGFEFFEKLPLEDKKQYVISYDFHLINKQGKAALINHKLTPLALTDEGRLWKAICIVSLSHKQTAGNVTIYRQGSNAFWELDMHTNAWRKSARTPLTERETDVLRLYAQGYTITQIADKICVAPDTVKYYRRRIFENLGVSSISEALAHAVNSKLI